jgi:predicted ATPase
VDAAAPSRLPHVGTRTPVLADEGSDLAAAVQTIIEAGFDDLQRAVADASDGATVSVAVHDGLFDPQRQQRGMLQSRCNLCAPPNYPMAHCDSRCGPPPC